MELAPYLNFPGTCREAFQFYADLFGGTITFMQAWGETPMGGQAPPGWHDKVMHATMTVAGHDVMGSDAPPDRFVPAQGTYLAVAVKDTAEGERIFDALAAGGRVHLPFQQTFWSPGFGMVVDRFGTPWMVNVQSEPA